MPLDSTTYIEPLTETEQEAKDDLFRWLDRFPDRVPALLEAVREGRMQGDGVWQSEPCRCVVWTLANNEDHADWEIVDDVRRGAALAPVEHFVAFINPGDDPSNSPVMAHLERWIVEWMA